MLKNIYVQNEARNSLSNRDKRLRYKIKKQIKKHTNNEKI